MKNKDRLKRELKQNIIDQAILNHWRGLVQAVESLRANPDDRIAVFELSATIQCLIFLSIEHGTNRLLKALPTEQRDLLSTIVLEGPDLARESLRDGTPLFEDMEFSTVDSVFTLMSNLMIGPIIKPEKQ